MIRPTIGGRWCEPTPDWHHDALCVGYPTPFFPPDNNGAHGERPERRARREAEAKAMCAKCLCRPECLEAGRDEIGVWGGLNDEERTDHYRQHPRRRT